MGRKPLATNGVRGNRRMGAAMRNPPISRSGRWVAFHSTHPTSVVCGGW